MDRWALGTQLSPTLGGGGGRGRGKGWSGALHRNLTTGLAGDKGKNKRRKDVGEIHFEACSEKKHRLRGSCLWLFRVHCELR